MSSRDTNCSPHGAAATPRGWIIEWLTSPILRLRLHIRLGPMNEGGPLVRRVLVTMLAIVSITGAAACSGASGTHPQSLSTSTSTSTHGTPSQTTSTASAPSTSASSTSGRPSRGAPTPTVTPPAQGAVNAYVADFNLGVAAERDPANADLTWIAKYERGNVKTQTQKSFEFMRTHHLAYRGAAPDPNVKVQSVVSNKLVILTSCLIVDKADPWTQYDTSTGKAVPTGKPRKPAPPYLLTIFMRGSGTAWQINSLEQDTSKTCTG